MGKQNATVTIKDVAERAGVSIATVSHVLNKTRYVSDELTNRVNQAIDELGYYPNLLVGSLRKKKTYTIGLVLPSISNETFGMLAENIQRLLFKQKYNLIICNTSHDDEIEREALNTLLMKKVDAIIAIPTCREGKKLKEIHNIGVPIVLVDRIIPGLVVDTVRLDNLKGVYEAIKYLIGLGHQHIGYIDRKTDHSHSLEQKIGYKKALEENGLVFDPENMVRAEGHDYQSGIDAAKTLIQKNSQLTALFAYYDITALGAMRGILEMGYRVPEEFSVVGFDGMPFTIAVSPRLTTISFPVQRIAKIACDLVIKRLAQREDDREQKVQDVVIVPRLIVRESTAAVRS